MRWDFTLILIQKTVCAIQAQSTVRGAPKGGYDAREPYKSLRPYKRTLESCSTRTLLRKSVYGNENRTVKSK